MSERDDGVPSQDDWAHEVLQIEDLRSGALGMGGEAAIARQHAKGKLDVRQRLALLFDEAPFDEIGVLAGSRPADDHEWSGPVTPANVVIGIGTIDGRRVAASGDDYTIRNGTFPDSPGMRKFNRIERHAREMQIPVVRLVDMSGASLSELLSKGYTYPPETSVWDWTGILSTIPVVAVACGPCVGLGAWHVAASHFSVQVAGIGHIFAAGPPIVAAGVGEKVSAEELGGVSVHAKHSGVVDNYAGSEEDAIRQVRSFLSYLPSSVYRIPERVEAGDEPGRRDESLLSIIPRNSRRGYNARKLLEAVLDRDTIFEIGPGWGRSAIVGLARLDGYPIGFIANDPRVLGGGMDEWAADKITRHIDLCDTFHVPIVNFVDQPGTVIGTAAERRGTVRKGLRVLAAVEQSTVPWSTVIVRRLFGLGGATHGPSQRLFTRMAWPSARWGAMPIEGGVDALYRRELQQSEDPDKLRRELEETFARVGSPLRTAEMFDMEDVIDPRDTRPRLCRWVADAYQTLQPGPVARPHRP